MQCHSRMSVSSLPLQNILPKHVSRSCMYCALWKSVRFNNGMEYPRLGLLAETRRLEPVFLARFQPNLASRMLGLSFLSCGPFLHILEFWFSITHQAKGFQPREHLLRAFLQHWNFERCILGGWMRMGLQNLAISRLRWCILGRWYRMGWLTCVV